MALSVGVVIMLVVVAGLAAGYLAASLLLLRHPHLLHRKETERRRRFPQCVHISHRGGAGEAYENTMVCIKNYEKPLHDIN